jgi:aspartate ammonia-lyase
MTRTETDSLGKKEVPGDVYFGIHTQRAIENFPISGQHMHIEQFHAIAQVKLAAARVNGKLGLLDARKVKAIEKAALEILKRKFDREFVIDIYQAGAGTPTHMNVNEVIANRATEHLGGKKGQYLVHPHDHVNMGQSTNDVFPTAMRLASLTLVKNLDDALHLLEKSVALKAKRFKGIVKAGRTHVQDAVPIGLWQEVGAWASAIKTVRSGLQEAAVLLKKIAIGGSAVGTGINTHPHYRQLMIKELRKITRLKLNPVDNYFEATQSMYVFAHLSAALRQVAIELTRISRDIQLLGSGPRTGFGELVLPAVEPGSSIMPGKVNPNMAEMLNMVTYQVMGNDHVVELSAQSGQLELNVMMPVIAHNIFYSLKILTSGIRAFEKRCVRGLRVNKKKCKEHFERSTALATFLNPHVGYMKAADVAKASFKNDKNVIDVIKERKLLSDAQIKKMFNPLNVTRPNIVKKNGKNRN